MATLRVKSTKKDIKGILFTIAQTIPEEVARLKALLKLVLRLNFDFLAVDKFLFIAGVFFGRLAVLAEVFNN